MTDAPETQQTQATNAPQVQQWDEKITPGRFENKTVIVTGAGAGIGRATALRIAREGGKVIACDISADRLADLEQEASELAITTVAGDVSDDSDVAKIVDAAGERIDGLANVAGIMDDFSPVHDVKDDIWDAVMRVNVTGVMKLTRAAVRVMLPQKSGSVVNVGSEAGLRGSAAGAAYTASKHALNGLTKNSAFMYAEEGLRFNAVCPGGVATGIEVNFGSEFAAARLPKYFGLVPGLPSTAQHQAALITYLLSGDSSNISGAIIANDGGWAGV
ncbi:SDR family NAD(P)-dependent oxidoreductase [Brevibacterium luteolum]|uniref:SDR family NAD(P)-dependent oxidoreductase n=1 Tax=Brevibacterium luteolum TaxID=199591 RepID=UPI00223AB1A0|nr:SDR family NAD(P)-dependent oxidoreductase [Brevibacterium luteolum]MCT1656507.1 SDR family NAD(P)-dependent oxidoreductase [Brevibacterium luteolum]